MVLWRFEAEQFVARENPRVQRAGCGLKAVLACEGFPRLPRVILEPLENWASQLIKLCRSFSWFPAPCRLLYPGLSFSARATSLFSLYLHLYLSIFLVLSYSWVLYSTRQTHAISLYILIHPRAVRLHLYQHLHRSSYYPAKPKRRWCAVHLHPQHKHKS